MTTRTKVEVGQVWKYRGSEFPFTITRIVGEHAYAKQRGQEECFCTLADDGYPVPSEIQDNEWMYWTITHPKAHDPAAPPLPGGLTFAQWLAAPRPGNCVCNIPKHQCRFHRW